MAAAANTKFTHLTKSVYLQHLKPETPGFQAPNTSDINIVNTQV